MSKLPAIAAASLVLGLTFASAKIGPGNQNPPGGGNPPVPGDNYTCVAGTDCDDTIATHNTGHCILTQCLDGAEGFNACQRSAATPPPPGCPMQPYHKGNNPPAGSAECTNCDVYYCETGQNPDGSMSCTFDNFECLGNDPVRTEPKIHIPAC